MSVYCYYYCVHRMEYCDSLFAPYHHHHESVEQRLLNFRLLACSDDVTFITKTALILETQHLATAYIKVSANEFKLLKVNVVSFR